MSTRRTVGMVVGLGLSVLAAAGSAQELEPVGVVTRVDGTATLARMTLPDEAPLKLRDPLYLADRITTGDRSFARLLLGGKALVTVRERSTLTITEAAGTSTIDVGIGKIAIAVVKQRMRPGESVEIRTPNAVAAIRGTVVIADVARAADAGAPDAVTTTITVLRGLIDFQQIDSATRAKIGLPVSVGALQTIRVSGTAPPRPVQKIAPEQAQALARQYRVSMKDEAATTNGPIAASQVRTAVNAAGEAVRGGSGSDGSSRPAANQGGAASDGGTASGAPEAPGTSASPGSTAGGSGSASASTSTATPSTSAPAPTNASAAPVSATVSVPAGSAPAASMALSAPPVSAPAVSTPIGSGPAVSAPAPPSPPATPAASAPGASLGASPGRSSSSNGVAEGHLKIKK